MISFGCFRLDFGCYLAGGLWSESRRDWTDLAISLFVDEELVVMANHIDFARCSVDVRLADINKP